MKKFTLTTTLKLLRKHGACEDGYRTLLKSLGPKWPKDKPINLLHILKSNGVQDMMWCLRATVEDSTIPRVAIAADMAISVLHIFAKARPNDTRVADCIKTCFAFVRGKATYTQLAAARAAARAAGDAAGDAAWAAAWAARDAARAAGDAEQIKQAAIIRKWLK